MSSKYKVFNDALPHHLTFTVIHWIDVFNRAAYKEIILESLRFCIEKKGLELHAWIIMPNHIHLIASMQPEYSMSGFVRDFKKYTSRRIIKAIDENSRESRRSWMMRAFSIAGVNNSSNEQYQFWQQDYHPIELSDSERLFQRLNYLHQNPVRAGLVWAPEDYKYSSAVDYTDTQVGMLPLVKISSLMIY